MSLPKAVSFPATKSGAVDASARMIQVSPTSQATGFTPGQSITFDVSTATDRPPRLADSRAILTIHRSHPTRRFPAARPELGSIRTTPT
jgi:hypothetical protein